MISEKDFEDIICKYPDLIEDGLTFKERQLTIYGRRMDVLFEDKFKRKLIIELKIGPIKDEHIGQILSYEGMLLSADDPTIRVMLVGNRVPPNIRKSLDHHGIAWKEIALTQLQKYLSDKNDNELAVTISEQDELLYKEKQPTAHRKHYPKSEPISSIDWKNPESHLSRIANQNTLDRVNYLRTKIKELDKNIIESGRERWMTYRIHSKLFVSIGCMAKNGNFTLGINLPPGDVKLDGYKSKDWGSGVQRNKSTVITFEPTVDYKDIDNLLEYIHIAYKKVM